MIAARLRKLTTGDGKPRLYGALNQDLPRGCLVMLRKQDDQTYQLVVVANDGRAIGRDPQSLLSFAEVPASELQAMRHD